MSSNDYLNQELVDNSSLSSDVFITTPLSDLQINPHRRKSIIPSSHIPSPYEKNPSNKVPHPIRTNIQNQIINEENETSPKQIDSFTKIEETDLIKLKSTYDGDNDDIFDQFILNNFTPYSGVENVVLWLHETEEKFNKFHFSRKQRFLSIPLIITGSARLKYIKSRDTIQSFDDFYAYLLVHYEKCVSFVTKSSSDNHVLDSSDYIHQVNRSSSDVKFTKDDTFDNSHLSPYPPILRSTAIGDLSTTVSSNRFDPIRVEHQTSNTLSSLDSTTNDLRKAILESFIKTPKVFKGGKEDVQKWLEDLDHLFNIAHIPDVNKLDLISYSLQGDALQWYKNSKSILTTWEIFVQEIKKAFISSYQQELSFKKLESYSQGTHQSIRNYYNEVLKLCTEADPSMTDSTKLKHLLSKAKPSIQFEVRRNKPTTPAEFLEYAREAEELFQLSNMPSDNTPYLSIQNSLPLINLNDRQTSNIGHHSSQSKGHSFQKPIQADTRHYQSNSPESFQTARIAPSHLSSAPARSNFPSRPSTQINSHNTYQQRQSNPSSSQAPRYSSNNNQRLPTSNHNRNIQHPRSTSHISPLMPSTSLAPDDSLNDHRYHQPSRLPQSHF